MATNVSKGAQGAASTVGQGINRFVEGNDDAGSGGNRIHTAAAGQTKQAVVQPERKDFWDSFGGTTTDNFVGGGGGMKKSTTAAASTATVGTAAMKSGSGMNGGGGGGNGSSGTMEHRGEEWGKDDW